MLKGSLGLCLGLPHYTRLVSQATWSRLPAPTPSNLCHFWLNAQPRWVNSMGFQRKKMALTSYIISKHFLLQPFWLPSSFLSSVESERMLSHQ